MHRLLRNIIIVIVFLVIIIIISFVKVSVERVQQDELTVQKQKTELDCTHNEDVLCTHLPLVIIETDGQRIEKNNEIWVKISVIDQGKNHINDTPDLAAVAKIKYRGASSYAVFDKKQYRIEFKKDYGNDENKEYEVIGMGAASDWVLNGPFLDRSLIRNRLLYSVSRELLPWAPDTRYCEVILDGKYQGLYLMVEPITNEDERINLTDFGLVSGQTPYLVKRDRDNTEENVIDTYGSLNGKTSNQLSISYPTALSLTKFQREYITNDISKIEEVLYSNQFSNPELGYRAYLDVNTFVDYYIINEFALITDAGYLSTYMYKDIDDKLKITVWDFNNSFNNYMWSDKSNEEFYVSQNPWFERLLQDRRFVDEVVKRYKELRQGILSDDNLLHIIDENVSYMGTAVDRNFEIWGYTFYEHLLSNDKDGNDRDPENFEQAINQLKTCIINRGKFLDDNIESLYQLCIN